MANVTHPSQVTCPVCKRSSETFVVLQADDVVVRRVYRSPILPVNIGEEPYLLDNMDHCDETEKSVDSHGYVACCESCHEALNDWRLTEWIDRQLGE